MKKLLSVLLTFIMLIACMGLVACDNNNSDYGGEKAQTGLVCEIEEDDDGVKYAVASKYSVSEADAKKIADGDYVDIMVDLTVDTYEYEGETYPIREISSNCFSNQLLIRSVKFSNNVEKFGASCLSGCINLESIEIPFVGETADAKNAQKVFGYLFGSSAIDGTSTISMKYNESGSQSFSIPNSLEEVTVTGDKLSDYAFYGTNLTKINLTGNIKAISNYAFAEMQNLKSFKVPAGVTAIGKGAFKNCVNLAKIDFTESAGLTAIGNEAFSGCQILGYGKLGGIVLPAELEVLGEKVFYNCPALTSLDLSHTKVRLINRYAFYGCTELAEVKLAEGTELTLGAFLKCEKLDRNLFTQFKGVEYAFDIEEEPVE